MMHSMANYMIENIIYPFANNSQPFLLDVHLELTHLSQAVKRHLNPLVMLQLMKRLIY